MDGQRAPCRRVSRRALQRRAVTGRVVVCVVGTTGGLAVGAHAWIRLGSPSRSRERPATDHDSVSIGPWASPGWTGRATVPEPEDRTAEACGLGCRRVREEVSSQAFAATGSAPRHRVQAMNSRQGISITEKKTWLMVGPSMDNVMQARPPGPAAAPSARSDAAC